MTPHLLYVLILDPPSVIFFYVVYFFSIRLFSLIYFRDSQSLWPREETKMRESKKEFFLFALLLLLLSMLEKTMVHGVRFFFHRISISWRSNQWYFCGSVHSFVRLICFFFNDKHVLLEYFFSLISLKRRLSIVRVILRDLFYWANKTFGIV